MRSLFLPESISSSLIFKIMVSLLLVVIFVVPAGAWSRHDANYSGQWQDTGTGWWYRYTTGIDTEEWNYCGNMRFAYQWNVGQWWTFGGDAWTRLGLGNVAPVYLMDGNYHDLRNGWWYQYTLSNDTALWNDSGKLRFSFQYAVRQWWDCGNVWGRIGVGNGYSAFVGDGAYHDMRNGWWYCYTTSNDTAVWNDSGQTRFALQYNLGQWWDHYSSCWHKLGKSGMPTAFIGDGEYHQVWGDGARYQYNTAMIEPFGYWSSSGVPYDDDYWLNYATGQWHKSYDGSTIYKFVEYRGDRQYLETAYIYWDADGYISSTPTGSSYGTDVGYGLWNDKTNSYLYEWYIFSPGSDLTWSGGPLDVVVVDTADKVFHRVEQYTKEDVIVIEFDLEFVTSLSLVLDGLDYLRNFYNKNIDTLAVFSHGARDGFYFGDWIDTSNYTSFSTQWEKLNTIMTDKGHLELYHCETGEANTMLSNIASWTNTIVFANVNDQFYKAQSLVNPSAEDDSIVWNYNWKDVWFGAHDRYTEGYGTVYTWPKIDFVDQDFEYQSDGSGNRNYKMLINLYNPGYPQANMVYWWNGGAGIP